MSNTDPSTTDEELSSDNTLRRRIVQTFGGIGVVSFAAAMLTPIKTLGVNAEGGGSVELEGQTLVLAEKYQPPDGDTTYEVGEPVTVDMMDMPDSILTFPEELVDSNSDMIRLHRLPEDEITDPTNPDWTAEGYVAYSAICTHLGCTVDWDTSDETATGRPTDHCFCHGSQFDPYEGAEVVHPPAERPLPQIGLAVGDEDVIELTSDFDAKVGT
ncbi:MAG: ubiquinol-cytochrome c reductase iron-sulfur subunit [Halanaeroarchaeum sp.]